MVLRLLQNTLFHQTSNESPHIGGNPSAMPLDRSDGQMDFGDASEESSDVPSEFMEMVSELRAENARLRAENERLKRTC